MESISKVNEAQFDAVLSKLLSTPAFPMSEISPKKKAKRKAAAKRRD
jgi:hypothetical protein